MQHIQIGEKKYPVRIDLNVLEIIQDAYGSINKFERELLGIQFQRDKDGNLKMVDGKPVMEIVEPSIKAIKTVLPAAINEGLAIEAEEENRSFEKVTEAMVLRECAIPFDELAKILHEEFKRCFATKK